MRCRVVLTVVLAYVLTVFVLTGIVTWKYIRRPQLEKAAGLNVGMSRAEVYEVMGGPPGDYYNPESFPLPHNGEYKLLSEEEWVFDEGVLVVNFADDGVVESIRVKNSRRIPWPDAVARFHWRVTSAPFNWFEN